MEKIYPDTKEGALALLREESSINIYDDNNKINATSDPYVEGVWRIELDPKKNDGNNVVIVYLAGYVDPWKRKRIINDWEEGYAF